MPDKQRRMQGYQGTKGTVKQIDDLEGMRIVGKIGSCGPRLNFRLSWSSSRWCSHLNHVVNWLKDEGSWNRGQRTVRVITEAIRRQDNSREEGEKQTDPGTQLLNKDDGLIRKLQSGQREGNWMSWLCWACGGTFLGSYGPEVLGRWGDWKTSNERDYHQGKLSFVLDADIRSHVCRKQILTKNRPST